MQYNPAIHHRRSIRLSGYDYTSAGLYFITICCHDRTRLFGDVVNGKMVLNDGGMITNEFWLNIPDHFPHAVLHEYVIMPNHVHGIVELIGGLGDAKIEMGGGDPVGAKNFSPQRPTRPRGTARTIGSIVRGFKIGVTKWFRSNTNVHDVWQRNYFDRIIRNERSHQAISRYIIRNPANWSADGFNPQ
jgi:REP element-mobilizing transposase RayT